MSRYGSKKKKVMIWVYDLDRDLLKYLRAENVVVVALLQGVSDEVPSFSIYDLFYRTETIPFNEQASKPIHFSDAFLYRYSLRDGTPATRLPADDFVSEKTSGRRLEEVISVHRSIQREINEGELGSEHEVLIERSARSEGDILGRTGTGKVVAFPGDPESRNTYRVVRLTSTSGPTFRGVAVT